MCSIVCGGGILHIQFCALENLLKHTIKTVAMHLPILRAFAYKMSKQALQTWFLFNDEAKAFS